MTAPEAAYIAGIIDGEGTITIVRISKDGFSPVFSVRVTVANTNARLIEWLAARGAATKMIPKRGGSYPQKRQPYVAIWSTRKAASLLREVSPYLVIKRDQANIALELAASNEDKKDRKVRLSPAAIRAKQALKDRIHYLNLTKP